MNAKERHELSQAMERAITKWLDDAGATYLKEYEVEGVRYDFLLVKPSPCILEVKDSKPRGSPYMKAKRTLAERIAIAERFGLDIPFISITSKDYIEELPPYFDGFLTGRLSRNWIKSNQSNPRKQSEKYWKRVPRQNLNSLTRMNTWSGGRK